MALDQILKSTKGRLIEIEVLVLIVAAVFGFLFIFGSYRRRSSSKILKLILWTANTVNYIVLSYIIGLMQAFPFQNDLFPIWALFLLLVFCSTDSFSAYSLEDNEHWKRQYVYLQILNVSVIGLINKNASGDSSFKAPLWIFWVLTVCKLSNRIMGLQLASQSNGLLEDKLVADYMMYEHELSNEDELDPVHMKGYNYLVTGDSEQTPRIGPPDYLMRIDITSNEVITVDKIWHCKGSLLRPDRDPKGRLKDVCLSFALCRLLRRRFSGCSLGEPHLPKTRDFVFKGLLSKDDDYERVFKVIEVELSFLFDFFYTKYPVIFSLGPLDLIISLLMFLPIIWLAILTFQSYRSPNGRDFHILTSHRKNLDAIVTFAIILVIIWMEVLQLFVYITSNWVKVWLLCKYIAKPSWQNTHLEKSIGFLFKGKGWFKPWENNIGQYSLLESFDHNPLNLMHKAIYSFTCQDFIEKTRKGQKEGKKIELPVEVKKMIFLSLKANEGRLTNGVSSLQRNGVNEQLSWDCKLKSHTTILVWHIATEICQDERARQTTNPSDHNSNVIVARSLSRYCAYLIVFVPELLPDHKFDTSCIFDNVVKEFRSQLAGCKTRMNKFNKLRKAKLSEDTIMGKGAKLGRELLELEEGKRWNVLADFWAEMMLYLTPSENSKAHAEQLAQGGEFITHLWALLSHAGILERDEASPAAIQEPHAGILQTDKASPAVQEAQEIPV